jgi:cytochrome c oxidase subunit 3
MRRWNLADSETVLAQHSPGLLHHFDDSAQQHEASNLGMWLFLVTEIMFFGGMFGSYTVYRNMYPEAFASTSHFMNVTIGAINTAVLICSSFTMVLAVRSAKLGRKKALIAFLVLTIVLGGVFLGLKGVEYHEKWVDHHVPGPGFQYEDQRYFHQAQILFFLYFAMTGLHAVHMIVGIGLLTALIVMASRNEFSAEWNTPVDMIGLYWHFVDIVWIFLFPLLYLIGHTS